MSKIIDNTFKKSKEKVIDYFKKNKLEQYIPQVNELFDTEISNKELLIKLLKDDRELLKFIIKLQKLYDIPDIIYKYRQEILDKYIENRPILAKGGGGAGGLVGKFIVDEHDNFLVDENDNYIVYE